MTEILSDISPCPRCGGTHKALSARKLVRPSMTYDADGSELRVVYWAVCKVTREPIMATQLAEAMAAR